MPQRYCSHAHAELVIAPAPSVTSVSKTDLGQVFNGNQADGTRLSSNGHRSQRMLLSLLLLTGILFGSVAAVMAFLIVYSEYQKHRLTRLRLWKEALGSALVAFIVFLILAVLVGYWASHLGRGKF